MKNNHNNPELDFERISLTYENTHTGYVGIGICVFFLYFIISKYASPDMAMLWALAVCIAYLPRYILSSIFIRRLASLDITAENVRPWERYLLLHSILPFVCFTSVIFIPFGENTFIAILFCAVIIISLIAGGILLYSTSKHLILLFLNITLLSLIAKSFWMQDINFTELGLYLIVVHIILSRLINRQNKMLLENIALKIENQNLSLTDPLTKLWNRRHLYLYIDKLITSSKRHNEPFSIIILDIDYFKQYNDTHGHNAGDDLLVKVSKTLINCTREEDIVIRYGGEEFLVVLPKTNINQTEIIAQRIHHKVKENTGSTVSAGLALYTHQDNFDQLVHAADTALYAAKDGGRDRYIVATAV